jgi:hypothetical protein
MYWLNFFIICTLLISGCTSPSPQNIQNSNTVVPSSVSNSWEKYTIEEDHFDITIPNTWTVTERDKSDIPSYFLNKVTVKDAKIIPMNKILYITTPSPNVSAIITGIEFSNLKGTDYSNSEITRQFLDSVIPVVEQTWVANPGIDINGTRYENIFIDGAKFDSSVDPVVYKDNGNVGMRAGVNIANGKGEYLVFSQIIVKQNKNRIYFIQINYMNNAASNPEVQNEVSKMLSSLTPYP